MIVAFLQILISGFLWGLTGLYVRYFNGIGISSAGVVWLRVVSAFLVLFLFLLSYTRLLFLSTICYNFPYEKSGYFSWRQKYSDGER